MTVRSRSTSVRPGSHHETEPLVAKKAKAKPNPLPKLLVGKLAASEGADTGYYSGVTHSVASVATLSVYSWGRRPVIFLGTAVTAFFTLGFGLSVPSQASSSTVCLVTGFFYGITGAIHSVVGELCDETNESIAFPLYDIISALGFVIGPLIGGTFENPAKRWPDVFSRTSGAATSSDAIIDIPEEDVKPHSVRELLSIPVLRAVFGSSSALGFAGSAFTSGFVLMAYSPLEQGGLALSPSQIGRALSSMGAVSIPLKLCMPVLLRRFGTLNVFDFAMLAWSACFLSMPLASWVAQASVATEKYRSGSAAEWASIALTLFLSRLGCLAFSYNHMILTRDHTPGHASLGTANGLAELAQSLARRSLFAISAKKHLLGGYMWVVFMLVLSGFGSWMVKRIRKYRD
ncbi:major facilitator superfamily domain-containing protein [Cerioporus squamosus]|nr:major facilitator superfamily domain-containing protein [Cerioporus squamosus]